MDCVSERRPDRHAKQRWFCLKLLIKGDRFSIEGELDAYVVHPRAPENWARRWVAASNFAWNPTLVYEAAEVDYGGNRLGTIVLAPAEGARGQVVEIADYPSNRPLTHVRFGPFMRCANRLTNEWFSLPEALDFCERFNDDNRDEQQLAIDHKRGWIVSADAVLEGGAN